MSDLRVSILQFDIKWEDIAANLSYVERQISELKGTSDLVVLPEMFSTGFSMNPERFAEKISGSTISLLKNISQESGIAIAGSFIASEGSHYLNRGFFITPESEIYFYDKRHLFRMGEEPEHYVAGNRRLIVNYKGWNICLLICYDLRFPVWARNRNNEYDLLLFVANWPEARSQVWDVLLKARAIENMSYVCGVNRLGKDGLSIVYSGDSMIIHPRGNTVLNVNENARAETAILSKVELNKLRDKFPVWKDADDFEIIL